MLQGGQRGRRRRHSCYKGKLHVQDGGAACERAATAAGLSSIGGATTCQRGSYMSRTAVLHVSVRRRLSASLASVASEDASSGHLLQ
jgi:hypothetical protein